MGEYWGWFLAGLAGLVLVAWLGPRLRRRKLPAPRPRQHAAPARSARAAALPTAPPEDPDRVAAEDGLQAARKALPVDSMLALERATQAAAQVAREELARAAQEREAAELSARNAAQAAPVAAQVAPVLAPSARQDPVPDGVRSDTLVPSTTQAVATPLVLLADDSKIVRVKTGRLLTQHHYRVSYASDGLEAARQLAVCLPDVVITDVEMPGMDGFELTRFVRLNPRTAHIPVIMITAADDKHREAATNAGVSVLLGKPYPEDELIAFIRSAVDTRQAPAVAVA